MTKRPNTVACIEAAVGCVPANSVEMRHATTAATAPPPTRPRAAPARAAAASASDVAPARATQGEKRSERYALTRDVGMGTQEASV